ncbi:MAG: branched-chain amino acid ABC transporter permease [Proteobacteria bacterium]|nr:branched-chain amino acid ABC transporter permease [Pseudomonadota bacterium]
MTLAFEQLLNGLQLGVLLYLVAAGLTLVFGVMRVVNLAHGSFYMLGAYFVVAFASWTGSLMAGAVLALAATTAVALVVERLVIARLYRREPLDQLLATFGIVLFFDELAPLVWGPAGLTLALPPGLAAGVQLLPDLALPVWRLVILAAGGLVAAGLGIVVARTRTGAWIRAGAADPETAQTLGVNLPLLFRGVFALGAALAGLAGILTAPLLTVQSGMGNDILVLAFVVVVLGGLGSMRGALAASLALGILDTAGRAALPELLAAVLSPEAADTAAPALSSMVVYVAMAAFLWARPDGLFPAPRR